MSRIRSKHTKPEIALRKMLRENGIEYKLHAKKFPGKPDIIIPASKVALFINGCFWHQHKNCRKAVMPKSNKAYWLEKLAKNIKKQKTDIKSIAKLGWKTKIIWECQIARPGAIERKLKGLAR